MTTTTVRTTAAQLTQIAQIHQTPTYVYNLSTIDAQLATLYSYFSPISAANRLRIYYAMKANYSVAILKHLYTNPLAYIETVSPCELLLALKCGFTPDRMMHTSTNMTDEEMQIIHESNVLLNIDSLQQLKRFGEMFSAQGEKPQKICIRFNSEVVSGECEKVQTGGDTSKFGVSLLELETVLDISREYNLKIVGLHEHTGSGISNLDDFLQGAQNLMKIVTKERFPDLEFMNFGGGFKVKYHASEKTVDYVKFGDKFCAIFESFCAKYGKDLFLHFEPGKYLMAESGNLLLTVNTLKTGINGRVFVGTNSGFPHLIRPMFYDAYHKIVNISNPNGPEKVYDICGNICETDFFARDRPIQEIRLGDVLCIENAGAYCASMGGVYNLRPMPAEVVIKDDTSLPVLAKSRLSPQQLAAQIYDEFLI